MKMGGGCRGKCGRPGSAPNAGTPERGGSGVSKRRRPRQGWIDGAADGLALREVGTFAKAIRASFLFGRDTGVCVLVHSFTVFVSANACKPQPLRGDDLTLTAFSPCEVICPSCQSVAGVSVVTSGKSMVSLRASRAR